MKSQRAFSLVEAAIVLAVVALVLGGIWAASMAVQRSQAVARAQGAIIAIATNMQGLYGAGSSEFPIVDAAATGGRITVNSTIISAGLVPADMVYNGTIQILNGIGWNIQLIGTRPFADNSIAITGRSKDKTTASRLLNSVINTAKSELLSADCWDGDNLATMVSWSTPNPRPSAPLQCASGTNGTTMGFYFRVKAVP